MEILLFPVVFLVIGVLLWVCIRGVGPGKTLMDIIRKREATWVYVPKKGWRRRDEEAEE